MRRKSYDSRIRFLLKKLATYSELGVADNAISATRLVLNEMSVEKGFERHDGRDYYVHPIAIAQTAIDFGLINFATGDKLSAKDIKLNEESDALLTACLLHDIIEDVDWVNEEYIIKTYGKYIFQIIDNVTKRKDEEIDKYLDRVASLRLSSLVKMLDRLNNVSTLADSTLEHRKRQLKETKEHYLPLSKQLRYVYFEDAGFYWQTRTIMNSILNEVERSIKFEEECIELKDKLNKLN